ncbi:MAG TPA: AMP-binding protein [Polyangia bacterium]|nr:AMP-binding protein [Polyangia bacterium]
MSEQGDGRPLFAPRGRALDAPFAVGEAPRTWGDLLSDAETLAASLGDASDEIVVACGDRYFGAVALLATWRVGRVAALPPNGREDTVHALADAHHISVILHDGRGAGGRALDVRARLGAATRAAPWSPEFPADRTLACVCTSGSTGAPLACRKTARQILGEAAMLARLFDVGPSSRVLATVPAHHIYGLLFGTLVPFMGGGALVRATPLHAETIAATARARGADVLCSVPAHLRGLGELGVGALSGLRRVFSSAAPLDAETATRVAAVVGRAVTEIFGSTETGGIAWRDAAAGARWRPLPGVSVDAEEDGAMIVRSPFVEAAPARSGVDVEDPPRHRSADRIAAHGDGTFELLGRGDGIVKIGGTRVSAAEIEQRLRAAPGVTDAAVLSVSVGGARGHELWAAVAPASVDVAELRAALARHVDAVAIPRRFRAVAALPREDNGKLGRARLSALFAPRAGDAKAGEAMSAEAMSAEATSADAKPAHAKPAHAKPAHAKPDLAASAPAPTTHTRVVHIPATWSYFEGHFDDFPILPGVVQLTDLVLPGVAARWPRLRRVRRIVALKFRSPILPGDALDLDLTLTAPRKVSYALRRRDETVSSGALEFAEEPG